MSGEKIFNPTKRFSNRVENYVKYRPHYPKDMIDFLKNECGLNRKTKIADIGSGTGISSELFLENGNEVFAVEPNNEMRNAAEKIFSALKNFISIDGTAEETTLQSNSIDMIISGQAFHWFDRRKCKTEFKRILKKNGFVVLMWNEKTHSNNFMNSYYDLLKTYGTDYEKVNHELVTDGTIEEFYLPDEVKIKIFNYQHSLDYEGLEGRLLSSSYIPLEGENYNAMIGDLKKFFSENNTNGKVNMEYETHVYYGHLN